MKVRLIAFPLTLVLITLSSAFGQSERQTNEFFPVTVFVQSGADWNSRNVWLSFETNRIVLRDPNNELVIQSIKYSEIKGLEYTHSTSRAKVSPVMALAANVFAIPRIFRKVDSHWLTIESERNETFLNLDIDNYQTVVAAFEANVGRVSGWNAAALTANQ